MNFTSPLLLDGGLSHQLQAQGCALDHQLWTANILRTNPNEIKRAHLAFLEAGARCLITSSYQASPAGFRKIGLNEPEIAELFRRSVTLAQDAKREFLAESGVASPIFIAASMGPYGATLADGSEYRGDYEVTDQLLHDFHQERFDLLEGLDFDCFACETMPSLREAKILAHLLNTSQKAGWITFSCKDENHISDGTPLAECFEHLAGNPGVFGLGVNCTHPKFITDLIIAGRPHLHDCKLVVYPNSGEAYQASQNQWRGEAFALSVLASAWLELGVDIIGGCCRIGPLEIAQLREILTAAR